MKRTKQDIELEKIIRLLEINNQYSYFLVEEKKRDRIHKFLNIVKTIILLAITILIVYRIVMSDIPSLDLFIKMVEISTFH